METFTRKKPIDDMFSGEVSLRKWVSGLFPSAIMEVVDGNLLRIDGAINANARQHCLYPLLN